MDTFIHYGLAAGMVRRLRPEATEANAERIGVVGSGIGGLPRTKKPRSNIQGSATYFAVLRAGSADQPRFRSFVDCPWHEGVPATPLPWLARLACIASRRRALIEYGDADVMVAGGAESTKCCWVSAALRQRLVDPQR